jgi:hypothetical protein
MRGSVRGSVHDIARAPVSRLIVALALIAAAWPLARAALAKEPATRVVWSRGDRVYVAAPDSGALAPRMLVRILEHDRVIASGEITSVLEGTLASVRLTSGEIDPRARLDRLEVRAEPAAPRPLAGLRVGLPASSRSSLAVSCADAALDLAALPRAYRSEAVSADVFRLVGADSLPGAGDWPETLVVRRFRDRDDEEIALERGELDVAVFWPGEPSARLRSGPFGQGAPRGVRARGVLAAIPAGADSTLPARAAADLAALDAEMFGGDLLPWSGLAAPDGAAAGGPGGRPRTGLLYRVDPALPGQRVLERFLNRGLAASPRRGERAIRIVTIDAPLAPRDSVESAWRARGLVPLFALRCPIFTAPARAADVRLLGGDAFANLAGCGPAGARP